MNKAREWLEKIQQKHFNDDIFPRIPQMTKEERRDYMFSKIDQMTCVDYESPTLEAMRDTFMESLKKLIEKGKDPKGIARDFVDYKMKSMLDDMIVKSPLRLCTAIWVNPTTEERRANCPFFNSSLLDELTEDERQQVEFLLDFTLRFGCLETVLDFDLALFIPEIEDSDVTDWNPIDDFNFDPEKPLEKFIATTPYRRMAAALCNSVINVTINEIEAVREQSHGELRIKCIKCKQFLEKEIEGPYYQFFGGFIPARQYIARLHALMHTAELDYNLNEILKNVERV